MWKNFSYRLSRFDRKRFTLFLLGLAILPVVLFFDGNENRALVLEDVKIDHLGVHENFLYQTSIQGEKILFSSDRLVAGADLVHSHPFWDPGLCSKMPASLYGDLLFFIDTRRSLKGEYQTFLWVFNLETKKLDQLEVPFSVLSFFFDEDGTPHLVTPVFGKRGETEKIVFYSINLKNDNGAKKVELLAKRSVDLNIPKGIKSFLLKKDDKLLLTYIDKNLDRHVLEYQNKTFVKYNEINKKASDLNYKKITNSRFYFEHDQRDQKIVYIVDSNGKKYKIKDTEANKYIIAAF